MLFQITDVGSALTAQTVTTVLEDCGDDPSLTCEKVLEWTGNSVLARAAQWFVEIPLVILLALLAAWIANWLVRRAITKMARRVRTTGREVRSNLPRSVLSRGEPSKRADARANAIESVLRSVASITIYSVAVLVALGQVGINLGPLVAGAGIAGVALGFGAQSLVKDFIAGLFVVIEDQYGVGDIIDLSESVGTGPSGVVERVTLRSTRLRDVSGTVWHVPNGEILAVGNKSQDWARALIDIAVAYETDLERAKEVIRDTAEAMAADEDWLDQMREPEVWGVEALAADGVTIRLVVKTEPAQQFAVERELRQRLKDAFDAEGIEIPFPQRTVWFRQEPSAS
ncbi:MAG: Small-conductance mechanosensitive channel [Acidimicrobiales bacterium]|nr:MAG: mechanosensitive ion channel family protein [Actinomycetota bacterium]MBV6507753.1 Small-conductance mechanosensitive channel [Acidimicrobiales bacterium]RIK06171.1 MAG: mechanosensitive ion channel protein MscS [Acidobacteriota bacterium]